MPFPFDGISLSPSLHYFNSRSVSSPAKCKLCLTGPLVSCVCCHSLTHRYGLRPSMKSNWKTNDRLLRQPQRPRQQEERNVSPCFKCRKFRSSDRRALTRPPPHPRPMKRTRSWKCPVASRSDVRRIQRHHHPPASTVSTWRSIGGRLALISCSSSTTRSCVR